LATGAKFFHPTKPTIVSPTYAIQYVDDKTEFINKEGIEDNTNIKLDRCLYTAITYK
jgi:hypothetical protein